MTGIPPAGIRLPGDFIGPELAAAPERFVHELDEGVRGELSKLLTALARGGDDAAVELELHAVMADATARTLRELTSGTGVVLVRGVPVHGHSRDVVARLYSMWGRAIGRPEPQNFDGELITDVRDTGEDPTNPDVRRYRTRAEQDFHTDGADVIGLLCLQGAKAGGESRVVSSVRVFQVLREQYPELAPLLFEPWFFRIPGAAARGLPEAYPRPIATFDGSKLETFFIGWYIRDGSFSASIPKLTDAQRALLDAFEVVANDPALYLDMHFRPGDVQWLRNAFILHKRTAYEDFPEAERKRHLLRLWLMTPGIDDAMPRFTEPR
jgi:alpha-ketoglutarate-dependent taurine dioxygenase